MSARGRGMAGRRLLSRVAGAAGPLLTREETLGLAQAVIGDMTATDADVSVTSSGRGGSEFALGEVQGGTDSTSLSVGFREGFDKQSINMSTDITDLASLKAFVAKGEAMAKAETVKAAVGGPPEPPHDAPAVNPALWTDQSAGLLAPEARLAAIELAFAATKKAGLVPAGKISVRPYSNGVLTTGGHFEFGRVSTAQYSVSARTKDGTGSGWAGWEGEDWSAAHPEALVARAVDLAERSRNPVAIEPGRYTVVLSADAVAACVMYIMLALDGRRDDGVFAIPHGGRKLGMKLFDPRVTISTDPMDPDGGYLPFGFGGSFTQYVPVKWIENGVLKALEFPTRAMAAEYGIDMYPNPYAYRMSGGTETVEEMIAATTRGIYVTRFSDVSTISGKTLFMTGVTRDGTFLIEHGKITKPIKNLRFEDSPMFFLNNLLAMGVPKRVLAPFAPSVVPPIMVQDFAFTSLTDSV